MVSGAYTGTRGVYWYQGRMLKSKKLDDLSYKEGQSKKLDDLSYREGQRSNRLPKMSKLRHFT